MARVELGSEYDEAITKHAETSASKLGRGVANIEDQIRAANQLIAGLRILDPEQAIKLSNSLDAALRNLVRDILETESNILAAIRGGSDAGLAANRLLTSFLMSFASRPATRERLNLFTTNYDRLIEYGCDLTGLRSLDRFVGTLTPVFRTSRVDVDVHYNPPGIRGEPRYLDGVIRLTKLHGSLDWKNEEGQIHRFAIPFGSAADHPDLPNASEQMIIYPNASKDIETSEYPYAELFRDCSAALCRPNSALVTYGYGFGDDHINRILRDMLALPSTHLVIISYDDASGRIPRFLDQVSRESQVSLLLGSHFGDLATLTKHYLPQSSADQISIRSRTRSAEMGDSNVTSSAQPEAADVTQMRA
ncbi:MAG TPA: SIR2 family protein [Longimicrobium sp.]|nr:SIR2 family protein [Longimicrobium sp.]